jgi:hypothetical protein
MVKNIPAVLPEVDVIAATVPLWLVNTSTAPAGTTIDEPVLPLGNVALTEDIPNSIAQSLGPEL